MRYNILFISSWFPNKLEPTNGNFVQRHAEAVNLHHNVEILHAIGNPEQKEMFLFDEKVTNGIRTLIVYYRNTKNPFINFGRRMKAYKRGFKRMNKPDLVHGNVMHNNMVFAVHLKKKYGIPFVVTEHWTALRKINHHITSAITKKTAKFIGNQASAVLPVSNDLKVSLQAIGIQTPMKVIPNVVDTELFTPELSAGQNFCFVHISNLIPRKNSNKILKVAIDLLESGYDFRLKIGGDGDIQPLKEMVKQKNMEDKIEVFGELTIREVSEKLRNSDCFILFSNDENQPCVISEAFASGLKVISTNVGGIAEFFPADFGILLEKPDETLLKNAMIKMLNNNTEVPKERMKSYAEEMFSKTAIADKFSEIYNRILKS